MCIFCWKIENTFSKLPKNYPKRLKIDKASKFKNAQKSSFASYFFFKIGYLGMYTNVDHIDLKLRIPFGNGTD